MNIICKINDCMMNYNEEINCSIGSNIPQNMQKLTQTKNGKLQLDMQTRSA